MIKGKMFGPDLHEQLEKYDGAHFTWKRKQMTKKKILLYCSRDLKTLQVVLGCSRIIRPHISLKYPQ